MKMGRIHTTVKVVWNVFDGSAGQTPVDAELIKSVDVETP